MKSCIKLIVLRKESINSRILHITYDRVELEIGLAILF